MFFLPFFDLDPFYFLSIRDLPILTIATLLATIIDNNNMPVRTITSSLYDSCGIVPSVIGRYMGITLLKYI